MNGRSLLNHGSRANLNRRVTCGSDEVVVPVTMSSKASPTGMTLSMVSRSALSTNIFCITLSAVRSRCINPARLLRVSMRAGQNG